MMEKKFYSNSSSSSSAAASNTAQTTNTSNLSTFRRSPWSWLTSRRTSGNSRVITSLIPSPCTSRKMSTSSLPSITSKRRAPSPVPTKKEKDAVVKTKVDEERRNSSFKRFGGQVKSRSPNTELPKVTAGYSLDVPMRFIDSASSDGNEKISQPHPQPQPSFWSDYQKYQSTCFFKPPSANSKHRRSSSSAAHVAAANLVPKRESADGGRRGNWGAPTLLSLRQGSKDVGDVFARASTINQTKSLSSTAKQHNTKTTTTAAAAGVTVMAQNSTAPQKSMLHQLLIQSNSNSNTTKPTPPSHSSLPSSSLFINKNVNTAPSRPSKPADKSLDLAAAESHDLVLHPPLLEFGLVALPPPLSQSTTTAKTLSSNHHAEQKATTVISGSSTEQSLPTPTKPEIRANDILDLYTPTKKSGNKQAKRQNLFKQLQKRSSFASFGEMRKAFAKAVTGGGSATTSSHTTATGNGGDAAKSNWLGGLRAGAPADAAHSSSPTNAGRHSPTKMTSANGVGDFTSSSRSLNVVAEKDRIIAELERRLRTSEQDNERLRKELDKVKSVLSITHSPNKIAAAAAAGRRNIQDATNTSVGDGFEAANQLNIDEEVQQESEKATPVISGSREYATKKVAISAESGVVADVKLEKVEKDFRSKHLIKNAILDNDFLKHLDAAQVKEMVEYMYPMQVPANCYIIRQGEEGNHLYVLALGSLTVEKDGTSLGRIESGKAFGELAILYGCNRTASVKSNELAKLWVLDRKVFQKIMIRNNTERQQEMVKLLRSVPVLSGLSDLKLRKVVDALEVDFYSAGDFIIRQGETGDYFFILHKGEVKITQHVPGTGDRIINTLKKGDFFGEKALVKEEKRTASVIAITDVECLALNREAFTSLIGDIKDIVDKEYIDTRRESLPAASSVDSSRQVSITPMPSPEEEVKNVIERPTPADFAIVATLGVGGFGRVVLVQHRALKDRTFAMKVMKKRHIVKTRQQEHVMSEKDILLRCKTPFICKLYATMKDRKYLYMLMEFLQGGELWTILRDCTFFDEVTVKFYTACALAALEYLHERCIIYRDLKPENMMLDSNGYGKLVDFGFAKNIEVNRKTWTFCGTPQYMSPEIILNKGHDHAVDYYALGIFMYELSTGTPPFEYNGDQLQCYNQILRGISAVEFPRHMSRGCISLIKRLCRLTAVERLGYQKGGVKDIKKHKFFQGFDWHGLVKRTIPAPIKPTIKGPTDTANFDEGFPPDNEVVDDDTSGWDENF